MLKASQVPTADMFSADARTGLIQDINIAFKQFQTRMTEIGNQYTGGKQKYFLTRSISKLSKLKNLKSFVSTCLR